MAGGLLDEAAGIERPAASWRPTPHASERMGTAYTEAVWQRAIAWFFWVSGMTYLFLIARPTALSGYAGAPEAAMMAHIKALMMAGAGQVALLLLYGRLRDNIDIGPGIVRVQARVPDPHACRCRLRVLKDGVVTGMDEGFLWLDDGTLYFKGLQTAFRLNPDDLLPVSKWKKNDRILADPTIATDLTRLALAEPGRQLEVHYVEPFDDHEARRRISDFRRALHAWLREPVPSSLESLLPPRGVHPSLLAVGLFRYEAVFAGGLMIATSIVTFLITPQGPSLNPGMAALSAIVDIASVVLVAIGIKLAWSQWRANVVRSRIAQQEAQSGFFL